MKYLGTISTFLACIATIKAQTPGFNPFLTPAAGQDIKAGQTFDILWQPSGAPNDATVTIKLLQGDSPTTMQISSDVASKIPSNTGRYTWTVPRSIKDSEAYGLVMYLDGKEDIFQYSFPFDIDGLDDDDDKNPTQGSGPTPKPAPVVNPETGKAPSPKSPDYDDNDDDNDDDKDDDKDDGKDDDKDSDDDDDDDDDDDSDDYLPIDPVSSGVPYPDTKYNNGTIHHAQPSGVAKPSAIYPPSAQPSSYPAPPTDKTKPVNTVNGAKALKINSFILVSGIVMAMAF